MAGREGRGEKRNLGVERGERGERERGERREEEPRSREGREGRKREGGEETRGTFLVGSFNSQQLPT